jgi:hypothetical protein
MTTTEERSLMVPLREHLSRPLATIQPVLARKGKPTVDLDRLEKEVRGIARVLPVIEIQSPEHWTQVIQSLGDEVDAIFPVSVPAYPTEIWNSHPEPLVRRGIPVVFWPLQEYDEPDFWRWSARDMLTSLGVKVVLVANLQEGKALMRAYGMRRFLSRARMVVFGDQNFPWNALSASNRLTQKLGTRIDVLPLSAFRDRCPTFSDAEVKAEWEKRKGRYAIKNVKPAELDQALRVFLSIRSILEERGAFAFGVNCYGDLIINGGRDVPCLAQALLREEGYIASCDGDFLAMESMALVSVFLDLPCMMSNMYPVSYEGALRDHFGDPLSPNESLYPRSRWKNLARLGHCGYIGIVSPEMTPTGLTALHDFGGTWEIKRDGRGCGLDGDMRGNTEATALELKFDGKTLVIAGLKVLETTRHGFTHCETTALLEFDNLPKLIENISREHTVIVYGNHIRELAVLADTLGLDSVIC